MRRLRFLGLRWGRWREWWANIRQEGRFPTAKQWGKMARLMWLLPWREPRTAEDRKKVCRDYRICAHCAFHDHEFRRCALCGCYMPYRLAAGGICAAKEIDPKSTIGF